MNKNISNKLKIISKEFNLNLMILFGSRVKNSSTKNSDYDLAIFRNYEISQEEEYKIYKKIENVFLEKEFDLVNLTKSKNITLQYTIYKEGIVIFESNKKIFMNKYNEVFFDFMDFKEYNSFRKEVLIS